MIISIASGKGGTGETTVAANLAASLAQPVTVLDCDVEEPNLHLFLHPDISGTEKVIAPVPEIDLEKCTLCRKCMEICRFNAIAVAGKTVVTFPELCHSCGGCFVICPEQAVTEKERVLGLVETVRLLGIPHGLIIIRAGIGDDAVYAYAKKADIPILMEIPFDKEIAVAYSRGELIIGRRPEYKEKFQTLYQDICRLADPKKCAP
ncbi:MAG: P-loop NTPase [Desulfotignum sp.]